MQHRNEQRRHHAKRSHDSHNHLLNVRQQIDLADEFREELPQCVAVGDEQPLARAGLVGDDDKMAPIVREETLGKVIEGVFDGQNMVGSDGKTYPVPANYASKSKLVQGDILKLTIAEDGAFLYKQIGPIPRYY